MTIYLSLAPQDEPVYKFLDKKRSEGKPYYVYMTAGANNFLRIYYARVKECMANLDTPAEDSETARQSANGHILADEPCRSPAALLCPFLLKSRLNFPFNLDLTFYL